MCTYASVAYIRPGVQCARNVQLCADSVHPPATYFLSFVSEKILRMKPHMTKTKLSFEEVCQMLDDFYNEVEIT